MRRGPSIIFALLGLAVFSAGCGEAGRAAAGVPMVAAGGPSAAAAPSEATPAPPPTTAATPTATTTTTTVPRRGVDPDLIYPTIEPASGGAPPAVEQPDPTIRIDPVPGTLALTFDDGPDPKWTPVILDILKEFDVKATFFVLGWKVDRYPDLARRIVEEGHSLQNHSYRHHNLRARSESSVAWQIEETSRAIFEATGTVPVCIRPPGGLTNARVERVAAEHGHAVILWSPRGDSGDYSHGSVNGVLRRAADWQSGDVTLMHDIWGWLHREALPVILADLEERGIGTSTICVPNLVFPVPEIG